MNLHNNYEYRHGCTIHIRGDVHWFKKCSYGAHPCRKDNNNDHAFTSSKSAAHTHVLQITVIKSPKSSPKKKKQKQNPSRTQIRVSLRSSKSPQNPSRTPDSRLQHQVTKIPQNPSRTPDSRLVPRSVAAVVWQVDVGDRSLSRGNAPASGSAPWPSPRTPSGPSTAPLMAPPPRAPQTHRAARQFATATSSAG